MGMSAPLSLMAASSSTPLHRAQAAAAGPGQDIQVYFLAGGLVRMM